MLKKFVTKIEDVDEKYRDLYEKVDGGFKLKVEKDDSERELKDKVDEFRATNVRLMKQVEDLTKKMEQFKDVDPEEFKRAKEALDKVKSEEEKALLKAGKIDEVVQQRTEAMRQESDRQIKALREAHEKATNELGAVKGRLAVLTIDGALQQHVEKVGKVRNGAMSDVIARGRSVWTLDDEGKPIPKASGQLKYGKKGEPLTMEEWSQELIVEAPHLFESGEGGGAKGGKKGDGTDNNVKVVANTPENIGKYASEIAKGTVTVEG